MKLLDVVAGTFLDLVLLQMMDDRLLHWTPALKNRILLVFPSWRVGVEVFPEPETIAWPPRWPKECCENTFSSV
jgi:hypothetical protein